MSLPAGTYTMIASKEGYVDNVTASFIMNLGANELNFTMKPSPFAGSISGNVYNNTFPFTGIPDARVDVFKTGTTGIQQIVKSNSVGYYIVHGLLWTYAYDLQAQADGFVTHTFVTNVGVTPGATSAGVDASMS
jgi:hypothetical protein